MKTLNQQIKTHLTVYVTRDIERALGITPEDLYYIVTNTSPYAIEIAQKYPKNILLINESKILDTHELLENPETEKFLNKIKSENSSTDKKINIVVFKNTEKIESIAKRLNLNLLNPKADLAEKIENKITQIEWLGELKSLLPKHSLTETKNISWNDFGKKPFIIQWAHGHTGEGSLLIDSEATLNTLKEKFPERISKSVEFINGLMFTSNICIGKDKTYFGNISYQITGALPFTTKIFSTVGNDWAFPHTEFSFEQLEVYNSIAKKIADKMRSSGWTGLFGIDVIYSPEKDEFNLIEINARQPASTTFESELQESMKKIVGENKVNTFESHIGALLNISDSSDITEICDGSQIIKRLTNEILNKETLESVVKSLRNEGFKVVEYNNTKINADLLRIQSGQGIMESHNKFNKRGNIILETVTEII